MNQSRSLTDPARVRELLEQLRSGAGAPVSTPAPARQGGQRVTTGPMPEPERPATHRRTAALRTLSNDVVDFHETEPEGVSLRTPPVAADVPAAAAADDLELDVRLDVSVGGDRPEAGGRTPTVQSDTVQEVAESERAAARVPRLATGELEAARVEADAVPAPTPPATPVSLPDVRLSGPLQQQLDALLRALIEQVGAVTGFIADSSGLPLSMAGVGEDEVARSSIAWRLLDGPSRDDSPESDVIVAAQHGQLVSSLFLTHTTIGPIVVGVRSERMLSTAVAEQARLALVRALNEA